MYKLRKAETGVAVQLADEHTYTADGQVGNCVTHCKTCNTCVITKKHVARLFTSYFVVT